MFSVYVLTENLSTFDRSTPHNDSDECYHISSEQLSRSLFFYPIALFPHAVKMVRKQS